ncbi:MAG: hypothetical protein D6765_06525 [Bacteroidetes bacterium]|nr:MAG: hypothetical protein D6765_06525 [Bacteroidota bacterium]
MSEGNGGKSSVPGTRPNYLYAVISVALVLFLIGLFGLLLLVGNALMKHSRESVEIMVEVKPEAELEELEALQDALERMPEIKEGSLRMVSKEEGARLMKEAFGEDFSKLGLTNPLYDVFLFHLKAEWLDPAFLQGLRERLRREFPVQDLYYQETLIQQLGQNLRKVTWMMLLVGAFFLLVAVTLIHNTIRLDLYSRRFLIKNMELVGASWEFISRPFLLKSLWYGLLSGVLALLMLGGVCGLAGRQVPELQGAVSVPGLLLLAGLLLLLGILISFFSTFYVVRRYLQLRVDDLY